VAVIGHTLDYGVESILDGCGQLLEGLEPAAPGRAQLGTQIGADLL